jgi:predicted transcriptional regulator
VLIDRENIMNKEIDEITESFYKLSNQIVEFEHRLSGKISKLEDDAQELNATFYVERTILLRMIAGIHEKLSAHEKERK